MERKTKRFSDPGRAGRLASMRETTEAREQVCVYEKTSAQYSTPYEKSIVFFELTPSKQAYWEAMKYPLLKHSSRVYKPVVLPPLSTKETHVMRRTLILVLLVLGLFLAPADAKKKSKAKKPPQPSCAANIDSCSSKGCSQDNHHDPDLNELKNIKSINQPVADRSLSWMISRENKVEGSGYKRGDSRKVLTDLKEGSNVRVVGYLLAVKQEPGGESCNCYLREVDVSTDNHLVLVNPQVVTANPLPAQATKKQLTDIFHTREAKSVTAEFTPRVRKEGHPNFTSKLQSIINKTPQGALWVRVTGQLMFDSEHFHQLHLNRATQWEIHPIMKLEYCSKGKTCKKDSNENWVDLDSQ
jgi:hypothetical protein